MLSTEAMQYPKEQTDLWINTKEVATSIKYIHEALTALGYTHDQIVPILIAYIGAQLST